jgi:RNA-dependent RNA polymerase
MISLRTVIKGVKEFPCLVLDLKKMELVIFFQIAIINHRKPAGPPGDFFHDYRLKIQLSQLKKIIQVQNVAENSTSHIIVLNIPPIYHRRLKEIASTFTEPKNSWRDADTWFRQTDIVAMTNDLALRPISLRKRAALVNIGEHNHCSFKCITDCERTVDYISYQLFIRNGEKRELQATVQSVE